MTWQLVIDAASRMVLGIGTEVDNRFPEGTDFGPDYPILEMEDPELDVYVRPTDPAFVSTDEPYRILGEPPA